MPPAFNLSQDQTLQLNLLFRQSRSQSGRRSSPNYANELTCLLGTLLLAVLLQAVSTHTSYLVSIVKQLTGPMPCGARIISLINLLSTLIFTFDSALKLVKLQQLSLGLTADRGANYKLEKHLVNTLYSLSVKR